MLDRQPRCLSERQKEALTTLARQVVARMTVRRQKVLLAAHTALKQSEENYRIVAESASDMIVTVDESVTILFVNPASHEILGYQPEELIGRKISAFIPEPFVTVCMETLKRYLKTGEQTMSWNNIELPAVRRDGSEIEIEISFGEHRGDKRAFTAVIRDITERKQTAEVLRKSEEYRNLFRCANDAILIFDPADETILDANERACAVYGFKRKKFLGKSIREMSKEISRGDEPIRELLRKGSYEEFETVQFRADGTRRFTF
ncbi:MAG: PAS domain S-box protein [Pyrinomonadaceae bacterium]|nr:PAS domain S-box protein [Pyrinomonadaceae bacterium]